MNNEKQEAYPLHWPQGWPRVRPQDQKPQAAWKRTANQYRDMLATELDRMGSPTAVISTNVPINLRGQMTPNIEPRDVGVAVYFSRPVKEDFSWQDVLGIRDPVSATESQIQESFKRLAGIYHPDRGGDIAMFQKVTAARDQAIRWLTRNEAKALPYVIACDQFREVRLNMAAIVNTIKAIRQIERCGTSSLLERAFKGFAALPEYAGAAS